MQQIMNDSQKFVDLLRHIQWKKGLSDDILAGVQSFLVTSSGGELGVSDDLNTAAAGASASNYASAPTGRQASQGTLHLTTYTTCMYSINIFTDGITFSLTRRTL